MSFKEMLFKGNIVFVEVDDSGRPLLKGSRAKMKYRLDDDREYQPNISNLSEIEDNSKQRKKASPALSKGRITAYTDGACIGNPGPAGLAYVITFPNGKRVQSGEPLGIATNNIAELKAILRVLEIVEDTSAMLAIHTDSEYSIGVLKMGWKAKANTDLIAEIKRKLATFKNVELVKVRGHAGVPDNELVDKLAKKASETQKATKT